MGSLSFMLDFHYDSLIFNEMYFFYEWIFLIRLKNVMLLSAVICVSVFHKVALLQQITAGKENDYIFWS